MTTTISGRLLTAAGALCVLWVAVQLGQTALVTFLVTGTAAIGAERLWRRHNQRVFRPGVCGDVAHYFVNEGLGTLLAVAVSPLIPNIFSFPDQFARLGQGTVVAAISLIAALLAADLVGYWVHRAHHRMTVLWRLHLIHHSSVTLDWLAGARFHPIETLTSKLSIFVVLRVVGCSWSAIAFAGTVFAVWGVHQHANVAWRWHAISRLFVTPEMHHWHHSNDASAYNKNFGGFLSVWDRWFGTLYLPPSRRPTSYGTDELVSDRYFGQLVSPVRMR